MPKLPRRCPSFHYTCPRLGTTASSTPLPHEQHWQSRGACPSPGAGCSVRAALRAAGPLFTPSLLAAREAFPPTHQQQVLSLRSNAGTESIPRQMFLRPLTQD